jgi:hypothetical protein
MGIATMLRFSKILTVAILGAYAMLAAPPAAHAQVRTFQPRILVFTNGGMQAAFTGNGGMVTSGTIAVGPFTVTLTGLSDPKFGSKAPPKAAGLELIATVTGGGPTDQLTILLTDTGYRQTGPATFADSVVGTITGPGSVDFRAFLDFSDTPFGMPGGEGGGRGASLTIPGSPFMDTSLITQPNPFNTTLDSAYSGSQSTMVTDTAPYSMTLQSVITGGDVTFTFFATNTPIGR